MQKKNVTTVLGCLKTSTTCKTSKMIILGYLALLRPQLECYIKFAHKVSRNTQAIWWERREGWLEHVTCNKRLKWIIFSLRTPKGNVVTAFKSAWGMDWLLTMGRVNQWGRSQSGCCDGCSAQVKQTHCEGQLFLVWNSGSVLMGSRWPFWPNLTRIPQARESPCQFKFNEILMNSLHLYWSWIFSYFFSL